MAKQRAHERGEALVGKGEQEDTQKSFRYQAEHITVIDKTRIIGLDIGNRRIGIAIGDGEGLLATPFSTIQRQGQDKDIAAILDIVFQEEVGLIIVGMPFSLDGSIGPQAERTLEFYEALTAASSVPADTWDERFSSVEAARLLQEAGISPSRNRSRLDASAAAVILQAYLDTRR